MIRLWHKYILRHPVWVTRVSVPAWDAWSKGELHRCDCGKVWAL